MRALRIAALFGFAALGIFLGFQIEREVLWVFYERPYGYEAYFPFPITWALYQFHHFLIGVITTALTLLCSRLLKFPDMAAIVIIFIASLPYFPLFQLLAYGQTPKVYMVKGILHFQAGYFIGMFALLGVFFFATKFVVPLVRQRYT